VAGPSRRVGVGGWRDNFYPPGLPQHRELHHASRALSAIEVNGTFYSTFTPKTFAKWRDETPEGFVFTLKAHRSTTVRRELAGAREAIDRFLGSGVSELGPSSGPSCGSSSRPSGSTRSTSKPSWPCCRASIDGLALRHVLEVRHPSFEDPAYLPLARRHGCVTVHTDSPKYPNIVDAQAPFAYLRLMRSEAALPTGYPPAALDAWAAGARAWSSGANAREAFVFFINGAKERAPAAAQALLQRLGRAGP
jgi:uncharacterized protein YecE (DUF72 family)